MTTSRRFLKHLLFLAALTPAVLAAQPAASSGAPSHAEPTATPEEDEYALPAVSDPLEGVNRAVFKFNHGFYGYVARPVAKGYEAVLPEVARTGIANAVENFLFPVRLVGNVLQGKATRAAQETGRFVVNSTVGLAGLIDVADKVDGLKDVPSEDAGQAFGVWGIPHGPYLVLPFLGPTSTRDFGGRFVDSAATPWNWTWWRYYEWEWATAAQVTSIVSGLPPALKIYDTTTGAAPDPYLAVRTGYLQFRDAQVRR